MNLDNKVTASGSSLNQTSIAQSNRHTVGRLSHYDQPAPLKQISENQIIKGEVTDLRNNEVTVTLADNTVVTGSLENGCKYAIGDTGAFRISSVNPKIVLEALPKSVAAIENDTIQKALDSAGLPKTDRNQLVVRELINHNMPINKQSIQLILQQSYRFQNAQIRSLVLMNKYNMEMTPETVKQFESYQNMEHQLLNKINYFSDTIPELLELLADKSPSEAVSAFGEQLLGILLPDKSGETQLESLLNATTLDQGPSLSSLTDSPETLLSLLDNLELTDDQTQAITNGSISLRDSIHLLNQGMEQSYQFDKANADQLLEDRLSTASEAGVTPDMEQIELEISQLPKTLDMYDDSFVQDLFSHYSDLQFQNNELGSILNGESRSQLMTQLNDFSLNPQLAANIYSGEAGLEETLNGIRSALSSATPSSVAELLKSPVFEELLRNQIASNWTIRPKQVSDKENLDNLYDKMFNQSKELESFFQNTLGNTNIGSSLSNEAGDMHQNLNFMQTLNQLFSYVQIPLKLREQNTQSELYVYTKKRSLIQNPDDITVLLHLDMEQLGPLDIHVKLNHTNVNATFYLSDKIATNLFREHIDELSDALTQKGYSMTSDFKTRERDIDIVKDFMEADTNSGNLTRYTFDIRA